MSVHREALKPPQPNKKMKLSDTTARRPRKTAAMKLALRKYNFALSQEDRYLGSVFVTPQGQRDIEAKTAAAYAECKALGMTHEHGL